MGRDLRRHLRGCRCRFAAPVTSPPGSGKRSRTTLSSLRRFARAARVSDGSSISSSSRPSSTAGRPSSSAPGTRRLCGGGRGSSLWCTTCGGSPFPKAPGRDSSALLPHRDPPRCSPCGGNPDDLGVLTRGDRPVVSAVGTDRSGDDPNGDGPRTEWSSERRRCSAHRGSAATVQGA